MGVPTIGCHCAVCTSTDPRDNRLRPSILVSYGGRNVLIDTTPDFRAQALRAHMERLDAVLFTHAHADHIMGLDDVRPFNFRQRGNIPIYAAPGHHGRDTPRLSVHLRQRGAGNERAATGSATDRRRALRGVWLGVHARAHPARRQTIYGFRFGDGGVPDRPQRDSGDSMGLLRGLDVLFLDALRYKPHPTHSTVDRSIKTAQTLGARRLSSRISATTWATRAESLLPPDIRLAYDGLEIEGGVAMRIYRSLEELPADFGPSALTIGNFDGVHIGHRRFCGGSRALADANGWKPSVLTFDPHPDAVVAPERSPGLMTSPEHRARLMGEEGIEQVLILPFTAEVRTFRRKNSPSLLVERLGARAVLVGDNFRFGYRQTGDIARPATGARLGFAVEIVPAVSCRGQAVSSSGIRALISAGRVALAERSWQPYALEGRVVKGRGVGSKQTVPTLNLAEVEVIPARGVYVTRATGMDAVTNVGYRPTFGASDELSIETFLLGVEGLAPGSEETRLTVEFLARFREERKFDSPEALKDRILFDARAAARFFRRSRPYAGQQVPDCRPDAGLIDLLLAGDNAFVIAMAVRHLPRRERRIAQRVRRALAVILRVALTFVAAEILEFRFVKLAGGLFILWIAFQVLRDAGQPQTVEAVPRGLARAIWFVAVCRSDHVHRQHSGHRRGFRRTLRTDPLRSGVSIPFIVVSSNLLGEPDGPYPIVIYLGAGILGKVGGDMALTDPWVKGQIHISDVARYAVDAALIAAILIAGRLATKKSSDFPAA